MSGVEGRAENQRVLLLAPTPKDAAMTQQVLAAVGVACTPCATVAALCAEVAGGAGAVVLTDHALALREIGAFADLLRRQPAWSDLPVILLAGGGANTEVGRRAMEQFGNVTVLERPVQMASLASVARTLIRSRQRQYQIREHLLERERTAEELRQSEARFRQLAESIPQLAWTARADGWILWYNRRWYEYTGTTPQQMDGWGWQSVHDPAELPAVMERWQHSIATGEPFEMEFPLRGADGGFRWFLTRVAPLRDAGGAIVLWFGTNTDIEDRRRMAMERTRLLEAERAARAEAERVSQVKDEFLATLSHELRTPLNAILGWSQILASGSRDEADLAEGLRTIERNARAQTQIIEDLLDMSRIINGKVRLDVQRIDLAAVIEAALETVQPAAEAKDIRVQRVLDPLSGPVTGDPNRLQQVFWNLLSNAIKFTPKGGRVQVLLERVNSHLEVSVIDTGEGIRPEFLPHVFDRFRQADPSTTRRHGGLGLGLSIVKQLVELHGGTIRAKSPGPGKGSTFVVSLPLTVIHPEHAPEPQRRHPRANPTPLPANGDCVTLDGVKVLVVDDEPDARALVKRLLEDCRATVVTAGSAAEALQLVRNEPPAVIVSDIGMPGEDGYTLIRSVRALGRDRGGDTPAVALTAYARSEDRVRAVQNGFQLHIAKPVEPAELVMMVAALAGRAVPHPLG